MSNLKICFPSVFCLKIVSGSGHIKLIIET